MGSGGGGVIELNTFALIFMLNVPQDSIYLSEAFVPKIQRFHKIVYILTQNILHIKATNDTLAKI